MFKSKIFILNDNDEKITCKQAAEIIQKEEKDKKKKGVNCRDSNIRYYIGSRRAKTLSDIREIRKTLVEDGINAFRTKKTHKVMVDGEIVDMTLRELHAIHPHKKELKLPALSARISKHGSTSDKIWKKVSTSSKNNKKKKIKHCVCCLRKRGRKFFKKEKTSPDLLSDQCIDCLDAQKTETKTENKKNNPKKKTDKKVLSVRPGTIIEFKKNDYEVIECYPIRGMKAELLCHRIMSNGQVLRRSTVTVIGNWQAR